MNCNSCGTENVEVANYCYHCGSKLIEIVEPSIKQDTPLAEAPACPNKSVADVERKYLSNALILAIIPGGLWTWCYTYQKDYLKIIGASLYLLLISSAKTEEGFLYGLLFVSLIAIWDVVVAKRSQYYENYFIKKPILCEASPKSMNVTPAIITKLSKPDPRYAHLIPTADMLPDNPYHNYPLFPKKEKGPSLVKKAANTATAAYLSYKVVSKL